VRRGSWELGRQHVLGIRLPGSTGLDDSPFACVRYSSLDSLARAGDAFKQLADLRRVERRQVEFVVSSVAAKVLVHLHSMDDMRLPDASGSFQQQSVSEQFRAVRRSRGGRVSRAIRIVALNNTNGAIALRTQLVRCRAREIKSLGASSRPFASRLCHNLGDETCNPDRRAARRLSLVIESAVAIRESRLRSVDSVSGPDCAQLRPIRTPLRAAERRVALRMSLRLSSDRRLSGC